MKELKQKNREIRNEVGKGFLMMLPLLTCCVIGLFHVFGVVEILSLVVAIIIIVLFSIGLSKIVDNY